MTSAVCLIKALDSMDLRAHSGSSSPRRCGNRVCTSATLTPMMLVRRRGCESCCFMLFFFSPPRTLAKGFIKVMQLRCALQLPRFALIIQCAQSIGTRYCLRHHYDIFVPEPLRRFYLRALSWVQGGGLLKPSLPEHQRIRFLL